jgi:hypothetical protein
VRGKEPAGGTETPNETDLSGRAAMEIAIVYLILSPPPVPISSHLLSEMLTEGFLLWKSKADSSDPHRDFSASFELLRRS